MSCYFQATLQFYNSPVTCGKELFKPLGLGKSSSLQ